VYSGIGGGKSIRSPSKNAAGTNKTSVLSVSKKRVKSRQKAREKLPVPIKLEIKERKLHKDDLKEQHFLDLRQFLHKKKRQEAIAAKMNAKPDSRSTQKKNSKIVASDNEEILGGSPVGSPLL